MNDNKNDKADAVPVHEWISTFIEKWKEDFEKAGYPTFMIPCQYEKRKSITEDAEFEIIQPKQLPDAHTDLPRA